MDQVQPEQAMAAIAQDVKDNLRIDDRLRQVEVSQASMGSTVKGLEAAVASMEQRLVREIQDMKRDSIREIQESRPKNVPAWVAVGVASLALVLSPLFTAYTQR